jgi:hypothetical protein
MSREHHVALTLVEGEEEPWLITSCAHNMAGGEDITMIIGGRLALTIGEVEARLVKLLRKLVKPPAITITPAVEVQVKIDAQFAKMELGEEHAAPE